VELNSDSLKDFMYWKVWKRRKIQS